MSYRGAKYLDDKFLGSWEFADRIENLRPGWSPVDWNGIDIISDLAKEARKRTGVEYSRSEANVNPVQWWETEVNGRLNTLDSGELIKAPKDAEDSRGWQLILETAIRLELEVDVVFEKHHWGYIYDDRVWITDRYQATGKLHKSSVLRHGFRLSGVKVRQVGRANAGSSYASQDWIDTGSAIRSVKLKGVGKLRKALAPKIMAKLLAREEVAMDTSTQQWLDIRDSLTFLKIPWNFKGSKPAMLSLRKDEVKDFAASIPRVRGVKPERLCGDSTVR